MLDIKFIVENPDVVKKDLEKRHDNDKVVLVDKVVKEFESWKKLKESNEKIRQSRNSVTREINELRKAGKDFKAKLKEAQDIPKKLEESDLKIEKSYAKIVDILNQIPNILHESVPYGKNEEENVEIKKWGKPAKISEAISHGELLEQKDLADFKRAAKVSGAGFYFLKGDLAKLEMALIKFASEEIEKKGFTIIVPPIMLRKKAYEGVVALQEFEDVMYKIPEEDSYLIATSEHVIAAMHSNETFDEKDLPIKYCGISPCFRKEIGAHGVDTKGLFRVHQFNKVEMFVFSHPKDSWKIHEEMLKINEDMIQKLEIPYRVVNICTGDIGMIASKKYDVEAWYPRQNKYGEIISTSNCTSYQATAKNIRFADEQGNKDFVHTLNGTALATSRILVAIVENFQNKDGSINVPKVLQEYVGNKVIGK